MRLTFVGDVHGNALALAAATEVVAAEAPDAVVLLGDLLTYGADVTEVVDRVHELCSRGARLLRGNHDALYGDLVRGERTYFDALPDWIRESVVWTAERADAAAFEALPFVDELAFGPCLAAHANPFGPRDFRYLNTASEHELARTVLGERGYRVGVFGHTHRARRYDGDGIHPVRAESPTVALANGPNVLNAGSIGQPRGTDERALVLVVDVASDGAVHARGVPVDYDVAEHVRRVRAADLGEATRERLARFFVGSG